MAVKTEVIKDLDSSRWHKIRKLLSGELGLILILTGLSSCLCKLTKFMIPNSSNLKLFHQNKSSVEKGYLTSF